MRFMLLNADYPEFLDQLYSQTPGLARASYDEQMRARNQSFFGLGDAYAAALRDRGHDAVDVHINNAPLQDAWRREHGAGGPARHSSWKLVRRRGVVPWVSRELNIDWVEKIVRAQIDEFRPDVVLTHDLTRWPPERMRNLVGPHRLLVGQHAAHPLPPADYAQYDLMVSSWPPTIAGMVQLGVRCAWVPLGFDPRVLDHLDRAPRTIPVSFVGSLGRLHGARRLLLEAVSEHVEGFQVWGPGLHELPRRSPIRSVHQGLAFGIDMFRVLARSRITLNHHGFAEPHANNMRLFEATGVGTLLLTDAKPDLSRLFTPGREILTYETPEECLQMLDRISEVECEEVAAAGQRRTLKGHTWTHSVEILLEAINDL